MRVSSSGFASPCHAVEDWGLLRLQLSTASTARSDGEIPPLSVVLSEAASLAAIKRQTGHLPFPGSGTEAYCSLSADIGSALDRTGPQLRGLVAHHLQGACDAGYTPTKKGDVPPWNRLMVAAETVASQLAEPPAVLVALDDAIEATRRASVEGAIVALAPRLDELRGVVELQRRSWKGTRQTIEHYVTVQQADDDGHDFGGALPAATAPETVLDALRNALHREWPARDWAVWIATLAGPGASDDRRDAPSLAGPIAVSGIACTGDVSAWLPLVREELAAAFAKAGQEVPPDVDALGEPARFQGAAVLRPDELWSDMAAPPSFVARVAVRATHTDAAIERARQALRAVYGFRAPELAQDVRPDVVIWVPGGGWAKPSSTARGRSLGEPLATRHATRAVLHLADDLGSQLDGRKLDVLRSRALVRDTSAPVAIRLMRAFTSLEAMVPPGQKLDHVAGRLWVRSAWSDARGLLGHLLDRVLDTTTLGPPSDSHTWEERDAQATRFKARLGLPDGPRWDLSLLDAVDDVLAVIHPNAPIPALARAARAHLLDPPALDAARNRHAAAFRRARRHRNLTTHGHRLDDRTLRPTVEFLADQLECAIAANVDELQRSEFCWLGSLATTPDTRCVGRTHAELLAAVASAANVHADN